MAPVVVIPTFPLSEMIFLNLIFLKYYFIKKKLIELENATQDFSK